MGKGEGWDEGTGSGRGTRQDTARPNEWKHGICNNCSPSGMCCLTCCFPPISAFILAEKLNLDGFEHKYLGLCDCLVGDCWGGGLFTAISTMLMRGKVRKQYNIEGSCGGDCIYAFCCTACTLCQMRNHVDDSDE